MISTSKGNIKDNSFFYLLWGWLVLVASLSNYAMLQVHLEYAYLPWPVTYALIISLYGLGTFVSGGILKFKPLLIGGIACWVISIVAFFVSPINVLLFTALSIVIAYLIPGYMLRARKGEYRIRLMRYFLRTLFKTAHLKDFYSLTIL